MHQLCSSLKGGEGAVREACEFVMGLNKEICI